MAKFNLGEEFEMQTRDRYTKVKANLHIELDGRELPAMAIVGEALQQAKELIEAAVKKSYEVVPERVDTPMVAPQVLPAQPSVSEPKPLDGAVIQASEPVQPPAPKPVPFG
jgi:hypothetical protein